MLLFSKMSRNSEKKELNVYILYQIQDGVNMKKFDQAILETRSIGTSRGAYI